VFWNDKTRSDKTTYQFILFWFCSYHLSALNSTAVFLLREKPSKSALPASWLWTFSYGRSSKELRCDDSDCRNRKIAHSGMRAMSVELYLLQWYILKELLLNSIDLFRYVEESIIWVIRELSETWKCSSYRNRYVYESCYDFCSELNDWRAKGAVLGQAATLGVLCERTVASTGARGSIVVKALCYKPEGRGFETRWGEWFLSIYLILPVALSPGVYSASNRNEYQKHKSNVSGE
jgi:hypothetical protein